MRSMNEGLLIGGVHVLSLLAAGDVPAAIVYRAGYVVDADGAPNAYGPNDTGLDYTKEAGHPARTITCPLCGGDGHANGGADVKCSQCGGAGTIHQPAKWWGVETVSGKPEDEPAVQGEDDPFPGMFIPATALGDPLRRRTDPRRYVDATVFPYVSVPPAVVALGARPGDVAAVCIEVDGGYKMVAAIIADVGPHNAIGEGSIALAQFLGLPADPRTSKLVEKKIVWILFPGSRTAPRWPRTLPDINAQVEALFNAFGGYEHAADVLAEP